MKKLLVPLSATLLAGAASAQTDSLSTVPDSSYQISDTTVYQPDSIRTIAFTRQQVDDIERASHAAAIAREERRSARAATAMAPATAEARSSSSNGKRMHGGAKLSLDRSTDPKGVKHWRRMSRRSTRQAPDSPPGTVPVY